MSSSEVNTLKFNLSKPNTHQRLPHFPPPKPSNPNPSRHQCHLRPCRTGTNSSDGFEKDLKASMEIVEWNSVLHRRRPTIANIFIPITPIRNLSKSRSQSRGIVEGQPQRHKL